MYFCNGQIFDAVGWKNFDRPQGEPTSPQKKEEEEEREKKKKKREKKRRRKRKEEEEGRGEDLQEKEKKS